jgi:diguanylate cyclase (GGDEF)-like protein
LKNKQKIQIPKYLFFFSTLIIYVVVFLIFHSTFGSGISALSIFPVALVGLYYGLKWGIFAGILVLVLNFHLMFFISGMSIDDVIVNAGIPGYFSVILAGIGAGFIYRINKKNINDLPEHEEYEIALKKSEQRFSAQFQNMIDGMAINEIMYEGENPVDWIITDVNPAYENIMNMSRDEVIGKRATEIYGSYSEIEQFLRDYDRILKTGAPISKQLHCILLNRNIVQSAFALGGNQLAVVFKDVTEQEQALQAEIKQREFVDTMGKITYALNETMKLDEVLDIILENLIKFVSFDAADITLIHDDRLKMARHIGYAKYNLDEFAKNFNIRLDEMSTSKWMITNQAPLIIEDTTYSKIWTVFPEVEWIKSYMGLPIFTRGKLVGFLNFLSAQKDFYKNFPFEQLLLFTEQAAIAIENSRTFEVTQKRSQRLAIINQVAFKMTESAELDVIQQLSVDSMIEALGVDQVGLALMNPDRKSMTIVADHPGPGNSSTIGMLIPLEDNPSMNYILENKSSFYSENVQDDPMLHAVKHLMIRQNIQSILISPLIVGSEVVGTIGCDITTQNRKLSSEEISLAEVLANLVAGRIEQARLLDIEKKRAEELAMLHETSLAITQPYDLSVLHRQIIEKAVWLLDSFAGMLYLRTDDNDVFECKVSFNNQYDPVGTQLHLGEGAAGIVAKTNQPLIISNYGSWEKKPSSFAKVTDDFPLLSVPVRWQSEVKGVIQITREPGKPSFEQSDVELLSLFSSQVAVTLENSRLYQEVQSLAVLDPLTQVYNRRGFSDIANREIERAQRFGHSLALLFLDIDHFKEVNDTHGHAAGDQILSEIAERCKNTIRNVDVISRHGGEEFIVLLLESDKNVAQIIAKRLQSVVKEYPFQTDAGPISITVSIGIAEFNEQVKGLSTLIHNADMALYKAKSSGRNRVIVFQPDTDISA